MTEQSKKAIEENKKHICPYDKKPCESLACGVRHSGVCLTLELLKHGPPIPCYEYSEKGNNPLKDIVQEMEKKIEFCKSQSEMWKDTAPKTSIVFKEQAAILELFLPKLKQIGSELDWKVLREKYFKECIYKPESGLTQHSLPPHDTFEWFMKNVISNLKQIWE